MTHPGLSVVVPAFNEYGNLRQAVDDVADALSIAQVAPAEIIVVNDGSTDLTGTLADRMTLARPYMQVRHHVGNRGLRAAYETGLEAAHYDHLWWVPGDGEITMDSLVRVLHAYRLTRKDLVVPYHGTPELRPWFRRALTWISTAEMNLLFGHNLRYFQGPVIYPTELARSLPRTSPGFFCMAEMLLHALAAGYSYTPVPLTHQERAYGVSKAVSWRRIWDAQMDVLRFWWRIVVKGDVQAVKPWELWAKKAVTAP